MAATVLNQSLPPRRVGFIDDSHDFLGALGAWLNLRGLPEICTSDPDEALRWARERQVDMMVSDLRMPAVDGVTLLEQVRSIDPDIKLVLLTGFEPTGEERKRLDTMGASVLEKSADLEQLTSSIIAPALSGPAEAELIRLQQRVSRLEQYHREWVADLVEQLTAIPKPSTAVISGSHEPFTIADLLRDVTELTPRGLRHVQLWRNALRRLRKGRKM